MTTDRRACTGSPYPLVTQQNAPGAAVAAPGALVRHERHVVSAAMRWFEAMVDSGADLDPTTVAYVYGPRASQAARDLMDACHDVEHHRHTAVS